MSLSSCSYANLEGTYTCGQGCQTGPMHAAIPSMNVQYVYGAPVFGAGFGYSTLSHGAGPVGCVGYFDLKKAYPQTCPPIIARKCAPIGHQSMM